MFTFAIVASIIMGENWEMHMLTPTGYHFSHELHVRLHEEHSRPHVVTMAPTTKKAGESLNALCYNPLRFSQL